MKETPKITVVTVTYNCKDTIEKTIQNVLKQTYPNIEYIVIDGDSTDGTKEIIERYSDQLAYYISEPDKGIYDAMNKGVREATGEWIIFRNSGDYFFSPSTIEDVFNWYEDKGEDLITGGTRFFEHDGYFDSYYSPASEEPCDKALFPHPSTFIRSRVQRNFPFLEMFKVSGDFYFFLNVVLHGVKYVCYPHLISLFDNEDGTSLRQRIKGCWEKIVIAKTLGISDDNIKKIESEYKHVRAFSRPLQFIKKFQLTNRLYRSHLYPQWVVSPIEKTLVNI